MHTNINEMNRAMERIVYREDGRALAGLATIVMRGGEIAYENAVGTQDFARNLPLRLDSRARIASVSKTFATIAAMQLKDAGKLDLDADAGEYLGFALRNPRYPQTPITTRMLLSHTSSLRETTITGCPSARPRAISSATRAITPRKRRAIIAIAT